MKNYIITSINSKDENPTHNEMLMKMCCIISDTVGERGLLLVDTDDGKFGWHRFELSEVQETTYYCDGHVSIVTENTEYTLHPTDDGPDAHYNPAVAHMMQKKYCQEVEHIYAFTYGTCYRCGRNIYLPGKFGISIERASRSMITGCPYCAASFCD